MLCRVHSQKSTPPLLAFYIETLMQRYFGYLLMTDRGRFAFRRGRGARESPGVRAGSVGAVCGAGGCVEPLEGALWSLLITQQFAVTKATGGWVQPLMREQRHNPAAHTAEAPSLCNKPFQLVCARQRWNLPLFFFFVTEWGVRYSISIQIYASDAHERGCSPWRACQRWCLRAGFCIFGGFFLKILTQASCHINISGEIWRVKRFAI